MLHEAFIGTLKRSGKLDDPRIEAAFRAIPRHLFLPDLPPSEVYIDRAIPTKFDDRMQLSSSSQPTLMAIMLKQLDLQTGQRVLEIGAGTGYNAALIAHIVGESGRVVSIDIDEDIVEGARQHLESAGVDNVRVICSDGGLGFSDGAPYDRIILTVGASDIAPAWWDQLAPDGRLLIPLSLLGDLQRSIAFERRNDHLESSSITNCVFVQLRGGYAEPEARRVPIGPEPGISMTLEHDDDRAVDADAVYDLLGGSHRDIPVEVSVTRRDLIFKLLRWLVLRVPDLFGLHAEGEMADRGIVPFLFGLAGEYCGSGGLLRGERMVMLMQPPDSPLPTEPPTPESFEKGEPFPLWVRSYGPDDTLAQELVDLIAEWERAGRPTEEERLHVRAYRKGSGYVGGENELVIEKRSTTLVLDWR
jgi:protein-L-isoaspartate(D-aspartate) O-methyltransferase